MVNKKSRSVNALTCLIYAPYYLIFWKRKTKQIEKENRRIVPQKRPTGIFRQENFPS